MKLKCAPTSTVAADVDLVSITSLPADTGVFKVTVLLPLTGSRAAFAGADEEMATLAALVNVLPPADDTMPTMGPTAIFAPDASEPARLQVTACPIRVQPAGKEVTLKPGGRLSVTTTLVATSGPALLMLRL